MPSTFEKPDEWGFGFHGESADFFYTAEDMELFEKIFVYLALDAEEISKKFPIDKLNFEWRKSPVEIKKMYNRFSDILKKGRTAVGKYKDYSLARKEFLERIYEKGGK